MQGALPGKDRERLTMLIACGEREGIKRSQVETFFQLLELYHRVVERLLAFLSNHTNLCHHNYYYDVLLHVLRDSRWEAIFVFV